MKTTTQERRALSERQANAVAAVAGQPLPCPNLMDAVIPRVALDASWEDIKRWHLEVSDRYAP